MKIKIETVRTNDFSMRFFRFGKGEKTMVILPGLSVQSVMGLAGAIRREYSEMENDFTIFVFDRREELPPVYPISEMAKDTVEAFKALGLREIFLFGASQGGMIAMTIALENPELVKSLVVGSSVSEVPDDRFEKIEGWLDLAKKKESTALYLSFGKAIYPPHLFKKNRLMLVLASKTVSEKDLERFIILAEGTRGFNVTERLDEIRCPVLVIGARDDNVLGPDAAEMIEEGLKGKPNFSVYMYDGFGHAAYDTAPDYRQRLLAFFLGSEKED